MVKGGSKYFKIKKKMREQVAHEATEVGYNQKFRRESNSQAGVLAVVGNDSKGVFN